MCSLHILYIKKIYAANLGRVHIPAADSGVATTKAFAVIVWTGREPGKTEKAHPGTSEPSAAAETSKFLATRRPVLLAWWMLRKLLPSFLYVLEGGWGIEKLCSLLDIEGTLRHHCNHTPAKLADLQDFHCWRKLACL